MMQRQAPNGASPDRTGNSNRERIMATHDPPLWGLAVYVAAVLAVVAAILLLSWLLGERHRGGAMDQPFESGVIPVGDARGRFPVRFYLVAVMFVIFDVEAAFIFAWAVAFRDVGWTGYGELVVFVAILGAALAYLWRVGALDWAPAGRTARRARRAR